MMRIAVALICLLATAGVASAQTVFVLDDGVGPTVITNGEFASTANWVFFTDETGTFDVTGGEAHVAIAVPGTNVQLYQRNIAVDGGALYRLSFTARNTLGDNLQVSFLKHGSPFTNYGLPFTTFDLTPTNQFFSVEFTVTAGNKTDARLMFRFSQFDQAGTEYFIDDVTLAKVTP